MVNHEIINKILNTSHDKAVGEFLDEWGEAADDPTTALVSIAASLREIERSYRVSDQQSSKMGEPMPNNVVSMYFDSSYRIEYRDGSQAERLEAATRVNEYDEAYKQAAEQKAGRPLSQTELLRGVTPLEDRSVQQRMADRDWRPKLTPRDSGKFDWMIEEAEKELRDKESNALTTEGYLNRLKGLRRKEDDAADAKAAEREWLADPFRLER